MEYWSIVGSIADRPYRAGELIEWPSRNYQGPWRQTATVRKRYSERRELPSD